MQLRILNYRYYCYRRTDGHRWCPRNSAISAMKDSMNLLNIYSTICVQAFARRHHLHRMFSCLRIALIGSIRYGIIIHDGILANADAEGGVNDFHDVYSAFLILNAINFIIIQIDISMNWIQLFALALDERKQCAEQKCSNERFYDFVFVCVGFVFFILKRIFDHGLDSVFLEYDDSLYLAMWTADCVQHFLQREKKNAN